MNPTPNKMPIVSQETFASVAQSLFDNPDENLNLTTLRLIEDENPQIAKYLIGLMTDVRKMDPKDKANEPISHMLSGICMLYLLLRSQAEADEMNENQEVFEE